MHNASEETTPLLSSAHTEDSEPPLEDSSSVDSSPASNPSPPPYHADLRIQPITADHSRRYDKPPLSERNQPRHITIPTGLYTLSAPNRPPVPTGWLEFIHPEGQPYFYHPYRRIVTDSNLRDASVFQLIMRAAGIIDAMMISQNAVLSTTTEVMLELDLYQSPPVCRYYFVDHRSKTEFWLESTSTESMQLPPVTSATHLKYLLHQHYWTHVEFFPMHRSLSVDSEEELLAILTHACIDYMTSHLSTVPYNQEQCEAYIKLIQSMPESDRIEGYRNCVLARLWAEIEGNYFVNLHGEDNPRLSRIQRLLPVPYVQTSKTMNFLRSTLFNTSDFYYTSLNELWIDKISYAAHWRKFIAAMLYEWKITALWTLIFLISSTVLLAASVVSDAKGFIATFIQTTSLISILLSLTSLASSMFLVRMHRTHLEASASEAGDYLENLVHSSFGLQPLAIAFALPWGTCIWSFLLLSVSVLAMSIQLHSLLAQLIVWTFVGCMFIGAYSTIRYMRLIGEQRQIERVVRIINAPGKLQITKKVLAAFCFIRRQIGRFVRLFYPRRHGRSAREVLHV